MLRTMQLKPGATYYDGNNYRRTDRDTTVIPPQLSELGSPTQPPLRQQEGTEDAPWHKQLPAPKP
eukprot:2687596-Amphidinium_carterae.1